MDSTKRVIKEEAIGSGQSTSWWNQPKGTYYTQCIS